MKVYRLIKKKYSGNPFDTEGAKRFGGRWNSQGLAALYASDSIALAALEVLAHLGVSSELNSFVCVTIEIPDKDVMALPDSALPSDWRDDPSPLSTAAIGDQFIKTSGALALSVPSTLIVLQRNILINPDHASFTLLVNSASVEDFEFDTRLLS